MSLLEQKDKLTFQEGPQLEETYMKEVGHYEEEVLREELEADLLQKKQQMIQTAINRREAVDEEAIDRELDKLREKTLKDFAGEDPEGAAALTDEKSAELQSLYHYIVKNYHPQTHPNLPAAHAELFKKAQVAYRCRDLDALRLIHTMLTDSEEESTAMILAQILSSPAQENGNASPAYLTDYSLSARLFHCFRRTANDAILLEEQKQYKHEANLLMEELTAMRKKFPFNTAQLLGDPHEIEAYRKELSCRMHSAQQERAARQEEISKMLEGAHR